MSKRFNNKRLLYLLTGLIAIMILTMLIKIPKEKATFKSNIVDFDTSTVSKIILNNRISEGNAIEFIRSNDIWTVRQGKIISAAEEGAVQNIFSEVLNIKPQSLAAINQSKWKEFDLTDSLATRIKFLNSKGKIVADIMIGKLDFKQPDKPNGGFSGNNIKMTSYVRLHKGNEVYAIDGLIPFSFNIKFDDWRDKTFLRFNKTEITNISYVYPADSSYKLIKKDSIWYLGSLKVDSLMVANYLNSLKLMHGQEFKDDFTPVSNPVYQILVQGIKSVGFSIKCYDGGSPEEYVFNSSLNPGVYFLDRKNLLFNQLFKPQSYFLKKLGIQ
jgi:Domain of unknown function (DUF4340)